MWQLGLANPNIDRRSPKNAVFFPESIEEIGYRWSHLNGLVEAVPESGLGTFIRVVLSELLRILLLSTRTFVSALVPKFGLLVFLV